MRQGRNGTSEGGRRGTAPTLSLQSRASGQDLQAVPGEAEGKWQGRFDDSQPSKEGDWTQGGGEGDIIGRASEELLFGCGERKSL